MTEPTSSAPGATPQNSIDAAGANLPKRLLKAAWIAVLLGLALELVLLAISAGFAKELSANAAFADTVQKLTWSVFVCVGLAVGTAASRARPTVMGLLGLLAAPAAFVVARMLHKGVAQALSAPPPTGSVPGPLELAILKSLEYALFGAAIGWIGRKSWASLRAHISIGIAAGLAFAALIVCLSVLQADKAPPMLALVTKGANEFLFPVGCSIALWAASAVGRKG